MNPTVSIIVPIYNAQAKLSRCIESVLRQDFPDFECILVNDGSTDDSGRICDSYAEKDERIRVIHKENTGVSDSRNQGIDEAGENISNSLTVTTGSPRMLRLCLCGRPKSISVIW